MNGNLNQIVNKYDGVELQVENFRLLHSSVLYKIFNQ